jgi:glyoxylase-like metal-dependent hydrolase (beta-lactamase superfamily II)
MAAKKIVPGVYAISLRIVNAFLLETDEELILIDTGLYGSEGRILGAIAGLGREPADVKQILVTHCHSDHTGSLAALAAATGAPVSMHPVDAELACRGETLRPAEAGPGLVNGLMYRIMSRRGTSRLPVVEIEGELHDGQKLESGLQVVHAPGHTAGQVAFLWPEQGGVLVAADAASNMLGLGYAPIYEDLKEGKRSLAKLAALDFEVACFGHGRAITRGASRRFREKWGRVGV